MDWFYNCLTDYLKRVGTQKEAAYRLGVSQSMLSGYVRRDNVPSVAFADRLLREIGGDIRRALPDYEPDGPPAQPLTVHGRVSAGRVNLAVEETHTFPSINDAWRESIYRQFTTGPVTYLTVHGDSMEPHYPDGCLLACARPATRELPDLTPVIARAGDGATLKLYRLGRDRRRQPEVELIPINFPQHDIQRFAPGAIEIDYIVLGFINPCKHGYGAAEIVSTPMVAERSAKYGKGKK